MEFDYSISKKFDRLKALRVAGNVELPAIQVEIADIVADLKLNGFSESDIEERITAVSAAPSKTFEEAVAEAAAEMVAAKQ